MPYNFGNQPNFGSGLAQGASEALNDFVMPQEKAQAQSKLALQMLSQRMEMEEAQKEQQDQFQKTLQSIPQDQFAKVTDAVRQYHSAIMSGKVPGIIDTTGITDPNAQKILVGALQHNDAQGNTTRVMEQNGHQFMVTTSPFGQVLRQTDMGLTKGAQKMIQQAQAQYGEAAGLLDNMSDMTKGFLTATNAAQLPEQFGTLKINQLMQTNPLAKAYFSNTITHAQRIENLITGNSRVSKDLVDQAQNSIPTMDDTVPTAQAKIQVLKQIFDAARSAAFNAYRTNPDEILKDFDQTHDDQLQPKSPISPAAVQSAAPTYTPQTGANEAMAYRQAHAKK